MRAQRNAHEMEEADDLPPPGFDDDEAFAPPPRREPPTKAGSKKDAAANGGSRAAPTRAATIKLSTVVGAAFGALMAAVGVNALALQKERHPAPWFRGVSAEDQARPAEPQPKPMTQDGLPRAGAQNAAVDPDDEPVPAPMAKPAPKAAPAASPSALAPRLPLAAAKPPERPHDATASVDRRPKDPIGELLKSGRSPAASSEPSAAVAAIQRTLAKLGYQVKIDGVIGGATQRAIAQFEHDHRLPVKGQLTARLFKEINAAARP